MTTANGEQITWCDVEHVQRVEPEDGDPPALHLVFQLKLRDQRHADFAIALNEPPGRMTAIFVDDES